MCLIIGVLVFFFRCSHSVSKLYTLLDNLDLHYVKQVADGVLHNPYYSSYMLMWLFSWIDLYQGKTGIIKWLIRTCLRQQHENNRVKTNVMCILCMSNGYLVSQPNLRCTEQWPFRIPIPAVSDSWLPWHYMCPVYLRLKTNKPTNKQTNNISGTPCGAGPRNSVWTELAAWAIRNFLKWNSATKTQIINAWRAFCGWRLSRVV